MDDLIKEFNEFFGGDAALVLSTNKIEITIGFF